MDSASSSGIEDGDDEINSLYFEIRYSSDFGRYLVAKEDIDEKTLLLSEKPLVYGPTDDKELATDTVFIFCLACCKQIFPGEVDSGQTSNGDANPKISENNLYNCSRCGWPVCDSMCERTPIHSENECKIFSHLHIPYPPPHKWLMYKSVILLRLLLLMKREPALWQDFLEKLEHHTDTRKNKANCVRADEVVLENLQYFIQSMKKKEVSRKIARKYRLPFSQDKDVLQRLIGVLNVNAFCANNLITKRIARCMFRTGSLFAHSCAPNCSWSIEISLFDKKPRRRPKNGSVILPKVTPQIQVYSAIPIKKGEIITIPYSTRHIFFGTLKRQISMESVGHFICKCRRCMDATELGTFMSSIRCFKCEVGLLLSSDPTSDDAQWICDNCECASRCSVGKVVYFVTKIQDQIDRVESKDLEWFDEQRELQVLFDKYYGKELHENHYLLHEISTKLVDLLEDRLNEHEDEEVQNTLQTRFAFHVKYLLKLANVILPGFNNYQEQLKSYVEEIQHIEIVQVEANTD